MVTKQRNQTLSLGVLSARHQEGSKTTRKRTGVSKQGERKQRGADEQRGQSEQKEEQWTPLWGPGCPTSPSFPVPTIALHGEEVGPSNNTEWMNGHQLHLTLQETRIAAEIGSWASFLSCLAVTTTCLR